jgi:signal peptidase II
VTAYRFLWRPAHTRNAFAAGIIAPMSVQIPGIRRSVGAASPIFSAWESTVPLRRIWPWIGVAMIVVVVDQVTKFWVQETLVHGQAIEVLPFFNLVMVFNPGAAFSFLSDQAGWQNSFFIAIATIASGWIVYLLARYPQRRLFCFALGLILGGAIGNLIDRWVIGAVVDFVDIHVAGYHWPAFNVADSAITCGAALLILSSFGKHQDSSVPETAIK